MERRHFLKLSLLSTGVFTIPFISGCGSKPFNPALAQPLFLSHIFDAKTMKAAGEAYIKQVPAEDSRNKLVGMLTGSGNITATTAAPAVHSYYDERTKEDFKALKTVIVSGWVLAVTEARQCALYSLTQN